MFEKKMLKEGIETKLIPAPREVSASCGTAAKVDCDKRDIIIEICKKSRIVYDEFYEINKK